MANTPFRNLISQGLQPVVLPYAQKASPPKGWHLKSLMSFEEADVNDALLADSKINIAVALAPYLVAVDVDIKDADTVDELFEKIQLTSARKLGAKGFTCIYRADGSAHKSFPLTAEARGALDEPNAKIEFLAGNHYTILPPSIHPDIQAPYQWLLEDQELLLENLPVFDREAFTALLTEYGISTDSWGTITEPKKKRGAQPGNSNAGEPRTPAANPDTAPAIVHRYVQGTFQDDPKVESLAKLCLEHISADCPYEEWVKIGLAINHSITGEKGARLFYNWSKTATKNYPENDIIRKASDIFHSTAPAPGRQLTFNHLEYRAKQNPFFHLVLTAEDRTALAVINNTIVINRYDIGDIATVVEQVEQYTIPEELKILPIHSEKIQAEFVRQIMGDTLVSTEKAVWCYDKEIARWDDAKKKGTGVIADAERVSLQYIQQHPRFTDSFIKADGTVSETKVQAAFLSLGSASRSSNIHAEILRSPNKLIQKHDYDFDNENEVLGLPNGIKVCLRTGKVSPIVPTDYITRKATVAIAPEREYGAVPTILMDAFSQNDDPKAMATFFQRLGGYFLSGDVSLQKVFCFLGDSNNGKTFIITQIAALLGEFAGIVSSKVLMSDSKQTSLDPDRAKAALVGLRLATVTDTSSSAKFDEEVFKGITDTKISYRKLYQEASEAVNHAKVVICCNDVPSLVTWDAAMQRRFMCIPFKKTYQADKAKDNALREAVTAGMSGLLRWFVDGRIAMLADGNDLRVPKEVVDGTKEQIYMGDPVSRAISEACKSPESDEWHSNEEISFCLVKWMQIPAVSHYDMMTIEEKVNPRVIGKRLAGLGFTVGVKKIDGRPVRGWYMDLIHPEFHIQTSDLVN